MIIKGRAPVRLSRRNRFLIGGSAMGFLVAVVALIGPREHLNKAAKDLGWGGTGWEHETSFSAGHVARGIGNWVGALLHAPTPPRLTIDLKFKYVLELRDKRAAALESGVLIQEGDDFVPATLAHDGKVMRVKMRLKGDLTDHLNSRKWSFRVHVRDGQDLFGMRRFSIQHPLVRGYQTENLFLETLRAEDILVPRYQFVDVVINGEDLGLMAMEEHFSKEMLEAQRRRESVIVRYDESDVWASSDHPHRGFDGTFDHYVNTTVDVFRRSQVAESPVLSEHARIAGGLLRAWSLGEMSASEVFDADRLGRYLAICELWGASHAVRWHNVRFAYDPVAARLEPIGYDAGVNDRPLAEYLDNEPWVRDALRDAAVEQSYLSTLARLCERQRLQQDLEHLAAFEESLLTMLHREFPLLRSFQSERLLTRSQRDHRREARAAAERQTHEDTDPDPSAYARLAHVWREHGPTGNVLELANAIPRGVNVQTIHWVAPDGTASSFELPPDVQLPIRLPELPFRGLPTSILLPITGTHENEVIEVDLVADGSTRVEHCQEMPNWWKLSAGPIPRPTLAQALANHEFLKGDASALRVEPGTWTVRGPLITPVGANLTIPADTVLRFEKGSYVCVRGALDLEGTAESPVVLEPQTEEGWGGVITFDAPRASRWAHAVVRNTIGISTPDWKVDAGVTFHESPLELRSCLLDGTRAEDALNVIRTTFELHDLNVQDTASDAFDADFCDGTVAGGSFARVGTAGGGDGVDVSGSHVRVEGTSFRAVSDKAVSVGEASEVDARALDIEDVGAGMAAKDGSTLRVADSRIRDAHTAGLIAYIKKASYGSARIDAKRVVFEGCGSNARVQTESAILLDGVEIETEDLDVDLLYSTTMRKAARN